MPNRIIREGFVDSAAIDSLSDRAECWYHRLMLIADDAGRYDGRPQMVTSRTYPLRDNIRAKDVEAILDQLERAGLLIRYEYGGKPYIQLTKWQKCGKTLNSKFPWKDGSYEIAYVTSGTRDGEREFVCTSLAKPTPCAPHADPIGTPCLPHTDPIGTPCAPHRHGVSMKTNTETETYTETETETNTRARGSPREPPFEWSNPHGSDAEFLELWNDWEENRKANRRKPLSVRSLRMRDAEFLQWGPQAAKDAIRESIANNWQGIFKPKGNYATNHTSRNAGTCNAPVAGYAPIQTAQSILRGDEMDDVPA